MSETTLTILTFEQWKFRNPDIEAEIEDCSECDGEGTHTCECGDEHDCGFCDASGKSNGNDLLQLYRDQKKKDLAHLDTWLKSQSG